MAKDVTLQVSVAELPDDVQKASATTAPTPPKPPVNQSVDITGLGFEAVAHHR